MPIVLGLNALHPNSSAAIVLDGRVVAAIPEERIRRTKYWGGVPLDAVEQCLAIANVKMQEVDCVALAGNPYRNLTAKTWYAFRRPGNLGKLLVIARRKAKIESVATALSQRFGKWGRGSGCQLVHVEHHRAHLASSFLPSAFDSATGVSLDGSGDFVSGMVASCAGTGIRALRKVYLPHSLGKFYSALCQLIGFSGFGDEGKVMGLAPYGDLKLVPQVRKLIQFSGCSYRLDPRYYSEVEDFRLDPDGSAHMPSLFSPAMEQLLGAKRLKGDALTARHIDIARATQAVFEDAYMEFVEGALRLVGVDKLVLSGGCALNSVANGKVVERNPGLEMAIHPAASDDGLAVGAALSVSAERYGQRVPGQRLAYLGRQYGDQEVEAALRLRSLRGERLSDRELYRQTVKAVVEKKIVGWFQGRYEWGPRALGNRSILADPRQPDIKEILNSRIKNRESFRPFAPAILAEKTDEVFETSAPSPYMLHVYRIRPQWRDRLPGVNHVDNTGRLQTVSAEDNPRFYEIISAFYQATGVPVLINTSFNENEPVVDTPLQAIDCFLRTQMDTLVLNNFLIEKPAGGK